MTTANFDPLTIRMPLGMREHLRRRAAENRRSMNSEIVHYLDRALAAPETKGPAGTAIPPGHGLSTPNQENADEQGNT